MKIDPVSLRLFVAVMEESAIARAAAREHIAPSAASRRLAELEEQLAVELFTRSNRGAEPTAAAYALLNLARDVLNDLDGIASHMRDYGHGLRGHVCVVANISAITQFLPAQLQGFLARHPHVDVRLQECISTDAAHAVAENAADIGIINDGHYGQGLALLPYRRDELVLIVPSDHALAGRARVTLADALPHAFVGAHPGSTINNQLMRAAAERGQTVRFRIQVTSFDAMCMMVDAGLGVGVLPRLSARHLAGSLRIRALALDEPWAQRQLVLCMRAYESLPPPARLLVDHLREAGCG
ncbi:MAG: HTH-type transcriptional regulator CysB [Paracidovorax wautersii]|uniref:HTH-type transcriptional regulator CysB n=1 Tax=Paracidovorax wautersii TaxID=1177982 RepID=A0A7V8JPC2_9BURK|nr:MAG: HTH-type transcriptional regulator CysB [Paracidovorax wautersii]